LGPARKTCGPTARRQAVKSGPRARATFAREAGFQNRDTAPHISKTRALAQTAKLLEEAPVLQRLKELEAMKELAAEVGEVNVIVGTDGIDALKLVRQ